MLSEADCLISISEEIEETMTQYYENKSFEVNHFIVELIEDINEVKNGVRTAMLNHKESY